MSGTALLSYLTVFSILGTILVVYRLLRTRLYHRYSLFFVYFIFRIFNLSVSYVADTRSEFYAWYWLCVQPVTWIFYVLVVHELVGLSLEKYAGIRTLGRWFMYVAIGISAIVSLISLLPKITPATPLRTQTLWYVFGVDRGITFSLVVFLLLFLVFLSRYPVPLGRNVIVHAGLYTVFFLSSTITVLMRSLFGKKVDIAVDCTLVGFAGLCMFAWFFLLSPKGEEVKVSIPHFSPEQEERILYKLDALNATLLKVGK